MTHINDLHPYQIADHEAYYIPDFVVPEEEEYLIRKISESPQQKWKQLANRRLQVWGGEITPMHVLLAQPMPPFFDIYPNLLARLKNTGAFASAPHEGPNHVIVNEYLPGQGIMPHEDGPAYHPVVATISLGSHSVFHYYKYNDDIRPPPNERASGGRTVSASPVLTILLEQRSLIITKGFLYTSHLHGIQGIVDDRILREDRQSPPSLVDLNVKIDNWDMLTAEEVRKVVQEGGVLKRGVRYSLTCRDVERVKALKSFMVGRK